MTDLWINRLAPALADPLFGTSGPRDSRILIVGEAWGFHEAQAQCPFVGASGQEFDRMLAEAGLRRNDILCTNVFPAQPPGNEVYHFFRERGTEGPSARGLDLYPSTLACLTRLYQLIYLVRPKLIIAVGNYALWALTKEARISYSSEAGGRLIPSGIIDFRGSMLWFNEAIDCLIPFPVLALLHPAFILRSWEYRAVTVQDLRRRVPQALQGNWEGVRPTIKIDPTFTEAVAFLQRCLKIADAGVSLPLSVDCETRRGWMTCLGFSTSSSFARVIPFLRKAPDGFTSYWTPPEEAVLVRLICRLLTHPKVQLIGQNFLYDMAYFYDHWGIKPRCHFDTMLAHHLVFPGTPQGLGYLSSLYCEHHRYWKDDNQEWDGKDDMSAHLLYNGEDCIRTLEVYYALTGLLETVGLTPQWKVEMKKHAFAFSLMCRGVRVDQSRRGAVAMELLQAIEERQEKLLRFVPQSVFPGKPKAAWYSSPSQQKFLFFEVLGIPLPKHRKTGQPTLNAEVMTTIGKKHPWLLPMTTLLLELRSLRVYYSTFIMAPLDPAGRLRCSFNPAGTETFRWSSSRHPLGYGTNLQNIPKGSETK